MRDSKDPDGPHLHLDPTAFRALLTDLKSLAQLSGQGLDAGASGAEILAPLVHVGREAVTQQVAATGYAAWAAGMDGEDRAYRTARRS